ncbi:MAG: hypothetical protein NT011_02640 [Kiritimatiellaeota bacterium]|nr:hypothetical protein [Kiritimatiellota bacterium]
MFQSKWIMRSLVILLFVLSGAALALGIILFQQRETLKGRTQKLELAAKQVAATLEKDDTNPDVKLTLPDDQLKTYQAKPGGAPAMDGPLNQMVNAAQHQLTRLNNTRMELADTKTTLANTCETLKITSNDLVTAQGTIKDQNVTIEARNATISEKEVAIQKLEKEKTDLLASVETMKQQTDDLEAENRDLTDANAVLQAKVVELDKMVNPELRKAAIPKGLLGSVAYVNPEWNFVIMRLSPQNAKLIMPDLELLIHRSDRLVGKVRVQTVVDNLVVAEIVSDWQQMPCEKGDYVMY